MSVTISTSIGNVTLKENYEGYSFGVGLDGPYIMKQYTAPSWDAAFPCINALQGSVSVSGGAGGLIARKIGHQCPESPNLYCLEAHGVGLAERDLQDSGRPTFGLPIINARYGLPPYNQQTSDDPGGVNSFPNDATPGTPYVWQEENIDFDVETIRLPGSAYTFDGIPSLPVDYPVTREIRCATLVIVRKFVPYLPFTLMTSLQTKVNSTTFLGQPAGQILFRKMRTRTQRLSDGTKSQEIEMHFKWREHDHNQIPRPDDGLFDYVSTASGKRRYETADLRPLLQ